MPTDGIHDRYDAQIKSLDEVLDKPVLNLDPWTIVNGAGNDLVVDVLGGRFSAEVEAPPQGSVHPTRAAPRTYDGDPRPYVGHESYPSPGAGGPPQTDDFLVYGSDGTPTGIKQFVEMNSAQREAYLMWLHDPAVQKYVGARLSAQEDAEGLAQG